ncbi:Hsp70 family protein [Corynebacterium doosanense]|nr:Hsp70 family protein [Corynebacterium doosanense]
MTDAVESVALSHRSNLMPSAVFLESDSGSDSVSLAVGDTAIGLGRRDPQRLALSPKRYIDHDVMQLGGREVPVPTVIGSVVRSVVERSSAQHGGDKPASVTFTHPEAWSVHSINQLVAAAEYAGVERSAIRLISEPRAAAIHYASQSSIADGSHVAVFDFGGGTLDIAVLRADAGGNFQVVATKGDNSLGGRTVDNLLFRWVLEQVGHDDPDLADYLKSAPISTMHSLDQNIREAKEMLSDTSSATITVSTPEGESDLLLTRDEFNHVIDGAVSRAVELTKSALDQAGVDTATTPIYMTGGSSRIPHMQNRLGELGRVMTLDDPKTVVCRGALTATMAGFSHDISGKSTPNNEERRVSTPPAHAPAAGAAGAAGVAGATAFGAGNAGAQTPRQPQPQQPQHQNQAQPETRVQPAHQADPYAQQQASVPSSESTSDGSNRGLLIGGAAVAALLVVGGGIWALNRGGGEEQQVAEPTTTVTSEESATSAAGSSSAAASTSASTSTTGDGFLASERPDIAAVVPAQLTEATDNCFGETTTENSSTIPVSIKDYLTETATWCTMEDDKSVEGYLGSFYVFTGDDAKKTYDEANSGAPDGFDVLQESSGDQPEIGLASVDDDGTQKADIRIFYPDDNMTLFFEISSYEPDAADDASKVNKAEIEKNLERYGF